MNEAATSLDVVLDQLQWAVQRYIDYCTMDWIVYVRRYGSAEPIDMKMAVKALDDVMRYRQKEGV